MTNILQITWRPDGGALLLVALEKEGFFNQICQLSYPNGKVLNITNDNHSYNSMTLAADGRALVAVRAEQEAHIWAWPGDDTGEAKQLTKGFEKYDGINVMEWLRDGKIVYEANPSGKTELLSIGADGRNAKPLAADLNYLTMSPDGNYIIIQDSDADGLGLFRVSLVGGEKKRLTTGTDVYATFSPDGQWVVFTRYADQVALWKVPIGGGEAIKLTDILGYPVAPAVSPDGRLIAFHWGTSGDRKLPAFALVPFEGGEVTKTFEASVGRSQGFGRGMTVRWSPDGQSFNYVAHREGVSNIWRQPIDGSQPVQVTDFRDGLIFNFAYSPDGKQLALSRGTFSRDVVLIALPPMIESRVGILRRP